jgi:hypothetical protein
VSSDAFNNTALLQVILGKPDDARVAEWLQHRDLDWIDFLTYTGNCLVTPSVAVRLLSENLVGLLDADIRDSLKTILDHNRIRNRKLVETFYQLTDDLNKKNITPMPLKGINVLLSDLYQDSGERITSDIDVLIHPDEVQPALQILKQQGYLQRRNPFLGSEGRHSSEFEAIDPDDFRHQLSDNYYHLTPIKCQADSIANVEIHIRPCGIDTEMGRILNKLARVDGGVIEVDGLIYKRSTDDFALVHTMHHMLVKDLLHEQGVIDYRHLQDCRLLMQRLASDGRGRDILAAVNNNELSHWLQFLQWQCEHALGYTPSADVQIDKHPEGERLIVEFERIRSHAIYKKLLRCRRFIRVNVKRLFSGRSLTDAFGNKSVLETAPLYLRYQLRRFKYHISRQRSK